MTLPSEHHPPRKREGRQGVILLEALIAFALAALLIGGGLALVVEASRAQSERHLRAYLAEYAWSKAQEYMVSYPSLPAEGEDDGGWTWIIREERVFPDGPSRFDADIALFRLMIEVRAGSSPGRVHVAQTLMARRP